MISLLTRWQVEIKITTFGKILPSVFFPPNLIFFFFLCDGGGQHFFNVQYLPFTMIRDASVTSCNARHQTGGGCSFRRRADYLKENMHCSKDQWLVRARCGSWAGGGDFEGPTFHPVTPDLDSLFCAPWRKEGVCRRNAQRVLRVKPWTRKAHRFYTFPSSSCEETSCCLWFNMCSLLLLQMRGLLPREHHEL